MTDVPFYLHSIEQEDIARAVEVLRSPFITTGSVTAEFESALARFLGVGHAVGLTNCTSALFLALKALGIGPGDEVITTPLSFVATANAILHTGAKPVFVDVDAGNGLLDAGRIEEAVTPRTKAILPVHLYGQMADMRRISEAADRHGLQVVEDAAHALEAARDGVRPGQLGTAACFSFYATKNITCGEGGAVAVRDGALSAKLKVARLHGLSSSAERRYSGGRYEHYDMEVLGYKCNMSDIQAALLLHQLEVVEARRARRAQIGKRYREAFSALDGVALIETPPNSTNACHLFTILVEPSRRDLVLRRIEARGVGVSVHYRPIHLMKYYRETFGFRPGMYPEAERIGAAAITLPLYPRLREEQISHVVESVRAALEG